MALFISLLVLIGTPQDNVFVWITTYPGIRGQARDFWVFFGIHPFPHLHFTNTHPQPRDLEPLVMLDEKLLPLGTTQL